jgi:hypothetical protein
VVSKHRWLAALAGAVLLTAGLAQSPAVGASDTGLVGDPASAFTAPAVSTLAATNRVSCDGDGTTGKRVQLLYVRETSQTDRLSQYLATFQGWAGQIDQAFLGDAQATGGWREARWVHDRFCVPTVTTVVVANGTLSSYSATNTAVKNAGYNRTDRKYLAFTETSSWCGLAGGGIGANDDRPGAENRYNTGGDLASVGSGCWGWAPATHELLHTLGAVVSTAPHATAYGHCWDDEDIMCYDDGGIPNPPGALLKVCAGAPENQLDCNHDDYYNVNPPAGSWLAGHWNVANSQFLLTTPPATVTPAASGFVPFATPAAALDTRDGTGGVTGKRGAGSVTAFPVRGVGGVPAEATAVQVRVAVGSASAATFLEVWPEGTPGPGISMINVAAGENISNAAVVPLSSSGKLLVYNAAGTADILVDVQGYYTGSSAVGFTPVDHTRMVDTRSGLGTTTGTIPAGGSRTVTLTGSLIPAGSTAVVVNLLVPSATAAGWLAAAPAGTASGLGVLNYVVGSTQSGATLKLSSDGKVTFYNKGTAAINLVVVGEGYYGSSGADLTASAIRVINTRTAGTGTPLAAGATLDVSLASAVPAGTVAAALNVTVTSPAQAGWLKVWPVGSAEPSLTLMDFNAGDWRANGMVVRPGTDGTIRIKNGSAGTVHIIVDVQGWYL